MKIKHVTQPTDNTCMSACLAMLTEQPIERFIKRFHPKYEKGETNPIKELKRLGFVFGELDLFDALEHIPGTAYLLLVPSLNKVAQQHAVVVECLEEGYKLHDPLERLANLRWYTLDKEEMCTEVNAYMLKGFTPAIRMWIGERGDIE